MTVDGSRHRSRAARQAARRGLQKFLRNSAR